ncbi:type 2 isopentenyl-diphosphate Delta-isomerase [Lacticaseibacillus mingshuiensis]|uniref:Isopentenyl-diphosphate delta-isomerase n=1 Tax=Lacticaseibacillus mingshuiensis TaxID=2799574 RepID=A0ABW4CEJ8_9LACO|nr:type 2 isopentenyl-diphosphate Delta-isomerase [Lacticaseibacillus mingshuiensis]
MQSERSHRKDEHVFLAEKTFQQTATAGFDQIRFCHDPLPETAVAEVEVKPDLFGWRWPFFINAMTGGSAQTGQLNAKLGRIARATGLALASGSQTVALAEPALASTFTTLRESDPDGFLLANIGASHGVDAATAAVSMLQANALEVHLNAVQETVMPEGERDFHWAAQLAAIVAVSPVPVIAKEVGFGMTREGLAKLQALGVRYVDIGGRGGTNFAQVENLRRPARDFAYLQDFGQTTCESLLEATAVDGLTVLATGGVRSPLDILKALRLGASAVGIAGQVLHWLVQEGEDAAIAHLQAWQDQLALLMAMLGARDLTALRQVPIVLGPALTHYAEARGLTI